MRVKKGLLLKIFDAASMQRWNDQIRPVEFTELDKQAHKMIIAYVLGKFEEDAGTQGFQWSEIVEGGIFEFLQRVVLTDLKPQLFHRIKKDRQKYSKLCEWVYQRLEDLLLPMGKEFCQRFQAYLFDTQRNVNRRIISAAHFYATKWEFDIIERFNPSGYGIGEIREDITTKQEKYHDLESMQTFLSAPLVRDFVDICAHLRFQIRWSHIHRVPKTSVLGHMLTVAIFSYFFSLQGNRSLACACNDFFTGLFHDLPEVLTRDVINPVKRSVEGLRELIIGYEKEEMENKLYKLLPDSWRDQIKLFTQDEYSDITDSQGNLLRNGELVKACDDLTAFIEACVSLANGVQNSDLINAKESLLARYQTRNIKGIDFSLVFNEFLSDPQ